MPDSLLKLVESLINEHGSATILRERLTLLGERIGALERDNQNLRAQLEQAQAHAQESQSRLDRFAKDNPAGWRCDGCGSVDLVRSGGRPDPVFGEAGIRQAKMTCRVCSVVSWVTDAD